MKTKDNYQKKNIVLIGMPGAGKSTIGVILAKYLALDFVDTDLLIQHHCNSDLQSIVDRDGYLALRKIEENIISSLLVENSVIATGGSAVYSKKSMAHLNENGKIVFLDLSIEELSKRIKNYDTRGIACPSSQTFESLYDERTKLYKKYAEYIIDCRLKNPEEITSEIISKVNGAI